MIHTNLHGHGHSISEVRSAIAGHYKRDSRNIWVYDIIGFVGLYYLVRDWAYLERIAVFAVAGGFVSGLRMFVDNSNRNWWLHRLNWDDAIREEEVCRAQEDYEVHRRDLDF